MRVLPQICALPTPTLLLLLLSISTACSASQRYAPADDVSIDEKYFPQHEVIRRRDVEIQRKLQWQTPTAVRKMSGDPGEKFYLDYWSFDDGLELGANQSTASHPLRLHHDLLARHLSPRAFAQLFRRDFECPTGSRACTSIDRPDSCCSNTATCQLIQDNGAGDVGCCPSGQSCGDSLGACPGGSTSCDGGGCCVAGFACVQGGCERAATTTVLVGPSTSRPSISTTTVTSITTITRSNQAPQVVTTTVVVVDTITEEPEEPSTTTATQRSTVTTTDCPENYRTCPESLGGGCCHTDRACGTGDRCPASTTSDLQPPDRPTSDASVTGSSATTEPPPPGGCPTGFYACKAFHQGGCCQTDRDCDTTSCPAIASTTIIDTGGVTVAAPTGVSGGEAESRTCRTGWISCPASVSGGCCPSGYGCEISTCTAEGAEASGNAVGKIQAESGAWSRSRQGLAFLPALGFFSSMVLVMGFSL